MQMQNHQSMLIHQQNNEGMSPNDLNEDQIRQLQEMYGQEDGDGEEYGEEMEDDMGDMGYGEEDLMDNGEDVEMDDMRR